MHFQISELIDIYPFFSRLRRAVIDRSALTLGASDREVQEFIMEEHSNADEFIQHHLESGTYHDSAEASKYILSVIDAELRKTYGVEYDREEAQRRADPGSTPRKNHYNDQRKFIAREYKRIEETMNKRKSGCEVWKISRKLYYN